MSDASKIDDGGQAFPHIARTGFYTSQQVGPAQYASVPELAPVPGLTKREYFAAAALTGIYASRYFLDHVNAYGSSASGPKGSQDGAAKLALAAADALIAASKEVYHA